MFRKMIRLLCMIICCLSLIGCTSDKTHQDEKLIDMVKEKEINEYLFFTYQIPFSEYEESMKKLYYKNYSLDYIKNSTRPVISYEDRKLILKDIINYTEEDLKELRQDVKKSLEENIRDGKIISAELAGTRGPLEISKVYYDDTFKNKVVFVKNELKYSDPNLDIKFYRRHIFREEDGEWKLWEVREDFHYGDKMPVPKAVELFSNYNGVEVEYPYTIDLNEYNKEWF
ncbi:MAG: hypothetical protein ACOX89_06690 [Lutispora sp.]|jgi:hypothetical protein